MKIYTSYFARTKKLLEMGLRPICVAGYAPKFFFDVQNAHFYPDLAPKREWWLEWKSRFKDDLDSIQSIAWYRRKYIDTVLANLNPEKVLSDLGDNAVMMCYEKPTDFCHRHIIAEWLMERTGTRVEEVQF